MHEHAAPIPPTIDPQPGSAPAPLWKLCHAVETTLERCAATKDVSPQRAQHGHLDRLLAACGFAGDAPGFFAELVSRLETAPVPDWRSISINGVSLPYELLLAVLEVLEPGDDLIDITSVHQLEELLRRPVPEAEREAMQEVLDRFPVRLSRHTVRQLRLSDAVGRQYLPFTDELDQEGLVHTWVGQFHSGVIERMYHNRVIMILNMSCPVYCRFCFRKHKECRQERPPARADVLRGVQYVESCPEVTEVVLTGGDPFMNRATLTCAVEGLLEVEHLRCLRLATRSLAYHPALFTQRNGFWMRYLKQAQQEAARRQKRIEIATHLIHPDELSLRSLDLIADLVGSGIAVYVQTPLLGGINDRGDELVELYHRLRGAGAEMHYVFLPCSPLQGNRAYRSSIDDGMRLAARLRGRLSDRAIPRFCTATAFGKIDWGSTGWAVEEDAEDSRFVWLRTPYTKETFASFTTDLDLSDTARRNSGGTLDARFMVPVGDSRWLRGPKAVTPAPFPAAALDPATSLLERDRFLEVQRRVVALRQTRPLRRVHTTRAEIDCATAEEGLDEVIAQLSRWQRVRDVVVFSSGTDPLRQPKRLAGLMDRLARVPQITAIRVRSRAAVEAPQRIRSTALQVLTSRNRLGAVSPLRVELELNVLHRSELAPHHGLLVDRLRSNGVAVYNVSLLLAGVNLALDEVRGISSACRRYGIEFHHLVVAGDPAQQRWHQDRAVHLAQVINIASELRRFGSGRELPRYVVLTHLGEGDLGVTAEPLGVDADGKTRMRLLAFKVDDDGQVFPWGELPEDAEVDPDGHPIVAIPGLLG